MTTVVNCKVTDEYDVYIGRPTVYGNPFRIRMGDRNPRGIAPEFVKDSRAEAIEAYRQWVLSQPNLVKRIKTELKDKVLGCYCKPLSCHGDVLAEIANGS